MVENILKYSYLFILGSLDHSITASSMRKRQRITHGFVSIPQRGCILSEEKEDGKFITCLQLSNEATFDPRGKTNQQSLNME